MPASREKGLDDRGWGRAFDRARSSLALSPIEYDLSHETIFSMVRLQSPQFRPGSSLLPRSSEKARSQLSRRDKQGVGKNSIARLPIIWYIRGDDC